jgi:23S rRNA (cytosine1962-C5)-methyltransferase
LIRKDIDSNKGDRAGMDNGRYELIDFGLGRKLERFGPVVLDRPCPAAERAIRARPELWREATARYDRCSGDEGEWNPPGALPDHWLVTFVAHAQRDVKQQRPLTFRLQPSSFGHVGVFPEQQDNWGWLLRRVARANLLNAEQSWPTTGEHSMRLLNLFAYTGGSTLAASAAGAEVVHIDAARNIVDRARENAALSGLADRPIRWITEDAMKFCRRELKRGNRYHGLIVDPPTYGHGPKGEPWKVVEDLLPLLRLCGKLTAEHRMLVLVTCHTSAIGPAELAAYVAEGVFGHCKELPEAGEMCLKTADGRKLPSGAYARWPGNLS